ncbi:hypothetical protein V8D89_013270 [Ganoderma adspersum]
MFLWPWSTARRKTYESLSQSPALSPTSKALRESVNTLVDSLPGLLEALDEVAQLHPFTGITVDAFRVAVELHVKRGGNDEKIGVLFFEMRDTMKVLLQLRGVKDESVGPDDRMIKARMQELVKQTAEDIKSCANACGTYAKQKLIVKVINRSAWEDALKSFIHVFANRHKAFTFALSIHGVGVDDANRKLKEIDAKVNTVFEFFSKVVLLEQQELSTLVEKRGGPAAVVMDNDVLRELLRFRPTIAVNQARCSSGHDSVEDDSYQGGDDLAFIKQEILDTPELSLRRNRDVFERKFVMQQRELAEEMRWRVRHENGRVMQHGATKPYERIVDPDIREIWREMQWPGHVEARQFVRALHDYYSQQLDTRHEERLCGDAVANWMHDEDEWALEWINTIRLQAIMEAFDDDGSGLITIAEVNHFTASCPKDWSLPHWLAYWAIGWQMTATKYRDIDICAKMFAIRSHIHPTNRNAVDSDKYLQTVWQKMATLTMSSSMLTNLIRSMRGLRAMSTLRKNDCAEVWKRSGRIEKQLFPLMWLLLRRDFEIFRLCRHTVIHKDELWDSADTILWVIDAFRTFACELFDFWHEFERFWLLENQRERVFAEVEYDDAKEDQDVDASKFLNYAPAAEDLYPPFVEDSVTEIDTAAEEAVRLILGRWNGIHIHVLENEALLPMPITFCFHAPVNQLHDPRTYEASAVAVNGTDYNVHCDYTARDDGTVEYSFTQTYAARIPKMYWTGTLTDDGGTLSGRWGYKKEDQPHTFVYKRTPLEVLVDRPLPEEFTKNRVKALWSYALTAIHNQVRRQLFSWSYLVEHRATVLARRSTFDDVRCFYIIRKRRQRAVPPHIGINCDSCGKQIYGTRMVCMECGSRFTFDFCDKPPCVGCTIETRDDISSPHLPTHDFVKLRAPIVHHREIGRVLRNAKAGIERANALPEGAENRRGLKSTGKPVEKSQVAKSRGGEKGVFRGREGIVTSPRSESEGDVVVLEHEPLPTVPMTHGTCFAPFRSSTNSHISLPSKMDSCLEMAISLEE